MNSPEPISSSIEKEGILLVDKPKGITSFGIVARLRRIFNVRKIGHSGTLDPFATGVMVMLIGKKYTRMSDQFIGHDKQYIAELKLGIATDTHDCEGATTFASDLIPSLEQIQEALLGFQGEVEQTPPMFSAKKIQGKKLYELARKGKEIERAAVKVTMETILLDYNYPILNLRVNCSKGTYIRTIADDLGKKLGCGAHLINLQRTKSGPFLLEECVNGEFLKDGNLDFDTLSSKLRKEP